MRGIKILALPLILFGLFAGILLMLGNLQGSWGFLHPDPCRLRDCFCEPFRNTLALQPINMYSNLGLLLAGFLIAWKGAAWKGAAWNSASGQLPAAYARNKNRMAAQRLCPLFYGATLFAAGLGSLFYHASLSRAGEWADLVGTYLFLSFLLFYNLSRLVRIRPVLLAAGYAATNLALGVQMIVAPRLQQIFFGGLAVGAIWVEILVIRKHRPKMKWTYLGTALACFAAGAALWVLDGTLLPCQPGRPIQWHALWHLLAAMAGGILYFYYLSENGVG